MKTPKRYASRVKPPADLKPDPVIEAYKRDVDDTLLLAQLRRTPTERLEAIMAMQKLMDEIRRAETERRAGR